MSARVLAGAVALAAALILCAGPATAQQQEECPASGNPTAGKRVKCVKTTSGALAIDLTNFDITTSDNHAVYGNHQDTGDIDIDVTGGVISTAAPNANNIHGVWARHQGNGDYDITVDGTASITLTSTTNEGYGVYGLTKRDGKILVEGSASITTNSDDSHGIYGYHYIGSGPGFKADGKIDIDVAGSASITTKGDEADGIYAFQYDSTQTATIEGDTDIEVAGSASITTEGERSHGISAWHAILPNTGPIYGDIEIDVAGSASITTKKDGSHGIYGLHYGIASATKSADVDLGLDGASIETEGDDAHGIFAWHYNESSNSKGDLEIDVAGGASITTGGAGSHGAYGVHTGAGGNIDLDVRGASTSVTTTGAGAHGVYAGHRSGEGTIAISIGAGASLTASGAKASGVRIGGFNSTTQALELAAKLGTDGYRQQTVTVNGSVTGGSGDAAGVYLSGGGKVVIGKDASLRAASGAAIRAARKLATETAPALHVSLTLDGRTMAQVFGDDYIMNDGGVTTIVLNGTTLHDEDGNTGNTARNGRWNVSLKSSQSVAGRDFSKTDFIEIETPPAPSKPGVTPGDRSVTLSWTSGGAGGSAITKWQYAYKQSYGYGSWSDICETSQDATCPNRTSHTVTGLINGNTYKFKVRAVNTGGPGVDSPESNAVTPAAPPGTPSWISFYPVTAGDASVNLYWFSPSDGGTGITKFQYAFASKPPGGNYGGYGSWIDACAMASDHDTLPDCRQVFFNAHTVTGLFNGTSYKFKVRAVNAIGGGAASPESIELALTGPPPPPEKPGATAGAGSVALTWISRGDGGHPITKWQYVKKAGDEDFETDWTDICVTATQPDCPERAKHTVTGLAFGTEYRFKVRAVNGEGDGAASPESDAVRPSNPVSTPSAPSITGPGGQPGAVAGDGSATFFWTSGGDGGSPITKWQYVKQAGDEDFETVWTDICVTATEPDCPDRTSHTVTGLTNGVTYRFRVRAVNRLGAGAASGATNAVTPVGAPSAPSITGPGGQPGAVSGDGSATLFWTSGGDGGSPITKWQYVKQAGDGDFETVWTDICVTAMEPDCPDRTSHTVTGLTNGVAYRFRVRAVNALGAGAASGATDALTPAAKPSAPSKPVATAGDGSVALSWTPGSDGGAAITKWQYVKQAGGGAFETAWRDVPGSGASTRRHTVASLVNGVAYRFKVRAVNAAGEGAASPASDAVTPVWSPPAMRGWLARFGRAVGSQAVEMISSRMNAPAPGGAKVTLGGRSVDLNADPDRYLAKEGAGFGSASLTHGGTDSRGLARARAANRPANGEEDSPAYREMTMSEFLRGGSFHLASAGEGESVPGGRWSLWGRGARTSFEGGGAAAIEGDVSTAMLGVDYEKNAVLMGVALSHARGEGGFESGGRSGVEATLTSAHPYLRFALNERVTAWGVLGMGRGEMTLEMDRKDVRQKAEAETDIEMRMAAFGLRGELAKVGGFDLAVKSDVLLAQTDADAKDGLDAVSAEATRLRVMLEASREVSMKDGGAFRPSVEAGLRHDGGDADEGAGVEVGGSLRFTSPALGLTLEFKARGLLTHEEEDAADWGAGGMIRIAPGEAGRGLALTVRPEMGETAGGAARLWGLKDASRLAKEEVRGLDPRVRAEVGYGLDAWGGLLTPYAGLSVSEGGSGIYRLGGRFKVGESLSMSVEGDVRERENDDPAHGVALRGSLRW